MEWVAWALGCFEQKFRKSWSASCCQPSAIKTATQQLWSEIAQDWARATLAPSSLGLLSRGRCPPPTAAGWRASRPPWSPSCSPPPPPPWSPGLVQCSSQACHSQASPLCTQHTHSWTCKTWRIVKTHYISWQHRLTCSESGSSSPWQRCTRAGRSSQSPPRQLRCRGRQRSPGMEDNFKQFRAWKPGACC